MTDLGALIARSLAQADLSQIVADFALAHGYLACVIVLWPSILPLVVGVADRDAERGARARTLGQGAAGIDAATPETTRAALAEIYAGAGAVEIVDLAYEDKLFGQLLLAGPPRAPAVAVAALIAPALGQARALKSLREVTASRDRFMQVASHELRNPLAILQLQVDSLFMQSSKDQAQALPPKQEKALDRIRRQTDRLARLITQILEISRIESGRFKLIVGDVDVDRLVSEVRTRVTPELRRSQVALEIGEIPAVTARWDGVRVGDVLEAMLINAVQNAGKDKKPIALAVTADDERVSFTVRDAGPGVAPEAMPHLFDGFERGVVERPTKPGLGMALSIAAHVARAHGGTLSVASAPGQGAAFTLTLPRAG